MGKFRDLAGKVDGDVRSYSGCPVRELPTTSLIASCQQHVVAYSLKNGNSGDPAAEGLGAIQEARKWK